MADADYNKLRLQRYEAQLTNATGLLAEANDEQIVDIKKNILIPVLLTLITEINSQCQLS